MQDNGMHKLGYYSSGLMFCVFAIAVFFTAPQVTYLGDRWSMVIGSITYCLLTVTQLLSIIWYENRESDTWKNLYWPIYVSQLVFAVVNGWGNALIFVCSSKYVNERADDDNKGLYNSLLWVLNTGSLVTGNLVAAYVIPTLSQKDYFLICLGLNILVCFYFLLVRTPRPQPENDIPQVEDIDVNDLYMKKGVDESYDTNSVDLVDDFILELDPNHDGKITEEEFMLVMKYIQ